VVFTDFLIGNIEAAAGAFTGQPALVAAGAAKSGGALLGSGTTADQKRRDAEIQVDLNKALGGDVATAMSILDGRFHSIAYSKALCEKAWAIILQQKPDIAATALQQYAQRDPANTSPSISSQLGSEWNSLVNKVKADVGTTVQQVGGGLAAGAANKVDPSTGHVNLPLSSKTIWIVALVAIALAAIFFLSRKRA
jgi:hypothetical protein